MAEKPNETHLGYIQTTITRMAQNSFQAKTWCITVICALLVFYLEQTQEAVRSKCMIASITAVLLFGILDVYYLYLERGYRYLYNVAAGLVVPKKPIKAYEMSIPKSERGFKKYLKALWSPSTGLFYLIIMLLLIALWTFTSRYIIPLTAV
ncbi:MAG: hypothetical protein IKU58_06760 [Clostridia bacterium]|nr:hypothetical protein [Clostridia bacterium]